MRIVADTNTFLAVALREPEKESLTKVLAGHALMAPEVLPFEIGNALTAMVKKRTLDSEEVQAALEMVNMIPVDLRTVDMRAALDIAVRFRIYAYDAYYLECATRYRAPLLTLDIGMQRVARELAIEIVELPT
ncbi:MAG: type II toxin-antitoxin system VapC family toxin [Candidatus Hydrogenedentes bacterium]|nr:type II toxin-antitoxin system VapC family toxin [Candidatus Hydrogenedentota bacterium]